MTPTSTTSSPYNTKEVSAVGTSGDDLDTPDELALRDLLLGIAHRTVQCFPEARQFLLHVTQREAGITGKWMVPVAMFELAILELQQQETNKESTKDAWLKTLELATTWLEKSLSALNSTVDMSSRLDTRITMLKDEIATKKLSVDARVP